MHQRSTRRTFLQTIGAATAASAFAAAAHAAEKPIQGFEKPAKNADTSKGWQPISDRKIRVGLVGNGVCKFAGAFGFQDHPNVDVIAVSDLLPDRCAELSKIARCAKTY